MYFNAKKETFYASPEILATTENLVAFTRTVSDIGVTADSKGNKIVPKGSLLDANGQIKNDNTVVAILKEEIDVTNGPQPGAFIEEGYILKDRLPVEPAEEAIAALKKITFK